MNYRDLLEKYGPIITSLSQASFYVSGNCSKLLENVSQDFYVNVFDSSTHYCAEVPSLLNVRLNPPVRLFIDLLNFLGNICAFTKTLWNE